MKRSTTRTVLAAIAVCSAVAANLGAQSSNEIGLASALALAAANNPLFEAARMSIQEAEGGALAARRSPQSNPELSVLVGPRFPATEDRSRATDLEFELEQLFRTGGQRQHRIGLAEARVGRANALAAETRRLIDLAVASSFYAAVAAAKQVSIVRESEALTAALHGSALNRLELGEGTQLDVNAAAIRLARVRRRVVEAVAQERTTIVRLVELIGLPLDSHPILEGDLPAPVEFDDAALLARASIDRPDLIAASSQVAAADSEARLADAEAKPDLTLRVSYARDAGDDVVMAGVRLELPFFNRNHGERVAAYAQRSRLQAEQQVAIRAVEAEIRIARALYEQAVSALEAFDEGLLELQEDSLGLLQRSFDEGEIGYPEVMVVQGEVLASREEHVDARLLVAQTMVNLRAAAAMPQDPAETRGES